MGNPKIHPNSLAAGLFLTQADVTFGIEFSQTFLALHIFNFSQIHIRRASLTVFSRCASSYLFDYRYSELMRLVFDKVLVSFLEDALFSC